MKRQSQMLRSADFLCADASVVVIRAFEYFEFPFHSHEFVEIAFISEGQGYHHIEERVTPVGPGQLFVIPVGISHVFRPLTTDLLADKLIVFNCLFSIEIAASLIHIVHEPALKAFIGAITNDSFDSFFVKDTNGVIAQSFTELYLEYSIERSGNRTALIALLLRLIVEVYRLHENVSDPGHMPGQAEEFTGTLDYLEHHYAEDISLRQLSGMSQWSVRQIQRLFHKHTGQPYRSYMQKLRIRKSCELLRRSDRKVSSIAESVGYKDVNTFLSVFKRITGTTPAAYRKGERRQERR